jgi:hypothetical protein
MRRAILSELVRREKRNSRFVGADGVIGPKISTKFRVNGRNAGETGPEKLIEQRQLSPARYRARLPIFTCSSKSKIMPSSLDSESTPNTAIHRMVTACQTGNYPALIARLNSGWAVLGQSQFLRGYSLLLPDPVVPHLNAMQVPHREQFLKDMAALGDAVFAVTGALRINYAMFGNVEPALHAHVIPRYTDEAPELKTAHPWAYDWAQAPQFDTQRDASLLLDIKAALQF